MLYNIFSGGSSYEIFLLSAYTEREAGCIVTQKGTILNSISRSTSGKIDTRLRLKNTS